MLVLEFAEGFCMPYLVTVEVENIKGISGDAISGSHVVDCECSLEETVDKSDHYCCQHVPAFL